MVGMAIGARDVARARRVAWTAAGLATLILGCIGLTVAIAPDIWSSRFTQDPDVRAAADLYLRLAGPAFAFVGMGMALYFASQGSGKVLGPVLAATVRLAVIAIGGCSPRRQRRAGVDSVRPRCAVDARLRPDDGCRRLHHAVGPRLGPLRLLQPSGEPVEPRRVLRPWNKSEGMHTQDAGGDCREDQ
jgi:hypothetical protein